MAISIGGLFELEKPEVTTIIRWMLRAVLVVVLAWLVRRKPEQEEEEEEEAPAEDRWESVRKGPVRGQQARTASARSQARLQPRRETYPPNMRQRRPMGGGEAGIGGPVDFDSAINNMSKPKDMWETRKVGEGPPQILRHKQDSPTGPSSDGTASAPALSALASLTAAVAAGNTGGTVAERMKQGQKPAAEKVAKPERSDRPTAPKGKEKMLVGHERPVTLVTWNRDGNLLFTCGKDKIICVWSIPDGEQLGTYRGHSGAVWSGSVTSDSRWLVTGGADQRVIVWEARASTELARVELPGVVRCVEWADRGGSDTDESERFVTCHNKFGSKPPAVTVWRFDGTDIEQLLVIDALPTVASQVRWFGEKLIASSHENGELVFWCADTGAEMRKLKAHDAAISKFEFSQDRGLVATCSRDKTVRIWDLDEGADFKQLYHIESDRPLNDVALGPFTRATAIGPPGQRPTRCCVIAAGGEDAREVTTSSSTAEQFGTVLFKLGKEEELPCELQSDGVTKGHFGPVHTLAFSLDGSAIASGSEDGCVRLHIFDPNDSATPVATPTSDPAASG